MSVGREQCRKPLSLPHTYGKTQWGQRKSENPVDGRKEAFDVLIMDPRDIDPTSLTTDG